MTKTEIDDSQIKPGTSNQILGVNSAGTSDEYKTLSGTTNEITVTNGVGTITLATPQAIATTSSPTFAATTVTNLFIGGVASDPGSPTEGQVWYNTTTHQWIGFNGTSNIVIG
jgi:hypothetical protein